MSKDIYKNEIKADQAAAICYKYENDIIEFLLIRTSGGRWIFPKGNIEFNENLYKTAERDYPKYPFASWVS